VTDAEQRLALLVIAFIACSIGFAVFFAKRTQKRIISFIEPFPPEWIALLQKVPLYQRMPEDLRHDLEPLVRQFFTDIEFIGCQGLEITEEMRLTIATQACVLVVSHGFDVLSELHSVLVYPTEFVVDESDVDEAGVVTEGSRAISGQTLDTDKIILSWRDVQEAGQTNDGYNVVLHEFAHYLDHSVGGGLTAEQIRDADSTTSTWHEVLDIEYQSLRDAVDRGAATLIDPYGAEDRAEFFAVATETFFELPRDLAHHHPALYSMLRDFYALDPAAWISPSTDGQ
jgi:Mlc titration factor MtfA (ptsG expression regulator)